MTPRHLKRRTELIGFGLLETIDEDGDTRYVVYDPAHGLIIRGHDRGLTLEEVERFLRGFESDPYTAEAHP